MGIFFGCNDNSRELDSELGNANSKCIVQGNEKPRDHPYDDILEDEWDDYGATFDISMESKAKSSGVQRPCSRSTFETLTCTRQTLAEKHQRR